MSDNDYLTILMDFYALYQKQNNRKAKMYCVMRMMQIEMARKKPWLRPMFPKISFTEDPQAVLVTFVDRKRPFYQSLSDKVERKWLIFVTLLAMALIALLVLVCNLDFLFSTRGGFYDSDYELTAGAALFFLERFLFDFLAELRSKRTNGGF